MIRVRSNSALSPRPLFSRERASSATTGFEDPSSISGLWIWLDVQTLIDDGVLDEGTISTWTDSSGLGHGIVSAYGGSAAPTLETNVGGYAGVAFWDGGLKFSSLAHAAGDYTFFAALSCLDTDIIQILFHSEGPIGGYSFVLQPDGGLTTNDLTRCSWQTPHNVGAYTCNDVTVKASYTWRFGTLGEMWQNTTKLTVLVGTEIYTDEQISGDSYLGIHKNGVNNAFSGFLHEFIAYDRALTDVEVALVQEYLIDRWGIV